MARPGKNKEKIRRAEGYNYDPTRAITTLGRVTQFTGKTKSAIGGRRESWGKMACKAIAGTEGGPHKTTFKSPGISMTSP